MDIPPQIGTALAGRYEIERELGRGGMATVFLARDIRHDRRVALKLLKSEIGLVLGVERFLAEIRVTANLQHPNLLPLFDSGEAAGLLYYVMPYVEGESLRHRIDREKQLPVDEAVRVAMAVAGALDYAHRHGVIHRDLKPENILLHEGEPVVADFGIALAVSNAGGNRITQTGLSLGTPAYMSPEQATGDRAIDGRTDIYSLGAVLYEMLTGDPPYTGSTAQAVIARVLTEKPRRVRATRETVPPHVEATVERALAKLPADRFATAHDFADALSGARPVAWAGAATDAATAPAAGVRRATLGSRAGIAIAAAVAAIGLAFGAWGLTHTAPAAQRLRFSLALGDSAGLPLVARGVTVALSPDGTQLVYTGGPRPPYHLFVRQLDDLLPRALPGTDAARNPQFSPDGKWIAFISGGRLKRMPVAGGPSATIVDSVENSFSWGDGDVLLFQRQSRLWRVPAAGGDAQPVTTLDSARGETTHDWPSMLPGGKAALFAVVAGRLAASELAAVRLSDGKIVRLGIRGVNPHYLPTGHVLFGTPEGTVHIVPFDVKQLRVTRPSIPVLENVLFKPQGTVEVSVSRNGTLVYVPGILSRQVTMVDRQGRSRVPPLPPQRYADARFSPDGKRIAMTVQDVSSVDVWLYDIASGTLTRMTSDGRSDAPAWSVDGRWLLWHARDSLNREYIRWQPWAGGAAAKNLIEGASAPVVSPKGQFVVVEARGGAGKGVDLDLVTLDSTPRRTQLVSTSGDESMAAISPDGRWLAYVSNETHRREVFVTAFPHPAGRLQISANGGTEPLWSPSGHEIHYRSSGWLLSATLSTTPELAVVRRDTLFVDDFAQAPCCRVYDISPDGKYFVILKPMATRNPPVIVLGWFDELRERLTARTP